MKDYKIGLFVFLSLATIISLFPPFEWGDENIRTEKERIRNRNILGSLPIKKYDFLFSSNKKYFPIGNYNLNEKVYDNEKINTDTSDAIIISQKQGIESRREKVYDKLSQYFDLGSLDDFNIAMNQLEKRKKLYIAASKNLNVGDWEYFDNALKIDSIKKYKIFTFQKPNYYLLSREIIFSELVIEYLLAGFIAFLVQIIITSSKRKMLNKKPT